MSSSKDTIAAIATPIGKGGIGVIRVSGPKSHDIYRKLTDAELEPRKAKYVCFRSAQGVLIDKGIAICFNGPKSFTGEDVLECYIHGSQVLLDMLLTEIITSGASAARPGEFTERAFLNNKIDLIQAEAVADLIESQSQKAAHAALQSLDGVFSNEIHALKERVFKARALIEAALDFPDEEDVELDLTPAIDLIKHSVESLNSLLARAESGRRLTQAPVVAIVGPPNVGKSCILNYLSGYDSAIVSNVPGTTRDTIREQVLFDRNMYTLIDTAGIRETKNDVEQEGISRAIKSIDQADIVLMVFDLSNKNEELISDFQRYVPEVKINLIIWNKVDICSGVKTASSSKEIYVSAKTGYGMDLLITRLNELVMTEDTIETPVLARQRHINALKQIKETLQLSCQRIEKNDGVEFLAEDLRLALSGFDEILGKTTNDDVLGEIFSQFCIGK